MPVDLTLVGPLQAVEVEPSGVQPAVVQPSGVQPAGMEPKSEWKLGAGGSVPTEGDPGGAELGAGSMGAHGSLWLRQRTGGVTPADAAATGGALGGSAPTGLWLGGRKPSVLAASECAPSDSSGTEAAPSGLTETEAALFCLTPSDSPTTGSTLSGVTKSRVTSSSLTAVGKGPTDATPGCIQPRLLAGAAGALTAPLGTVGTAQLPGAAETEEGKGGR